MDGLEWAIVLWIPLTIMIVNAFVNNEKNGRKK